MADGPDVDVVTSNGEAEHELISNSVEIERIDADLFRSKTLWLPLKARGVFGGQVVSQALLAATQTVPPEYAAHSLHTYFLLSASSAQPIQYTVRNLRQGKTYSTRSVKASQNGKIIAMMTCSFQIPEPIKNMHQWPFPPNVPPPEKCESALDRFNRLSATPRASEETLKTLKSFLQDRSKSPIETRYVPVIEEGPNGSTQVMFWQRARGMAKLEPHFQKCIYAYISDTQILGTVARTLNLGYVKEPPQKLGMMSTLDHAIWYYDHAFDCSDWILSVMESPRSGMGRGVAHGRSYTRDGRLIAVITQEGVVRPAPESISYTKPPQPSANAKL